MKTKKITTVALIITILVSVIMCATFSVNAQEDRPPQVISYTAGNRFSVKTPQIIKIVNRKAGADISWNKVKGAAKYRVFVRYGDKWLRLADTSSTNYLHTSARSNKKYTYTVRAMDSSDNYVSSYNSKGVSNRYFSAPVLESATSVYGGVKVTWKKVSGAPGYRVYRKTGNGSWEKVKDFTTALSFTDKNVKNSTDYTYTVRVVSTDKIKNISSFSLKGVTVTYRRAPEITATVNGKKGVLINFTKVAKAAKYGVYVRKGNKWVKIGSTREANIVYSDVRNGVYYTYTVRAFDADGNFLTGYNPKGYTAAFYKAPVISSVTSGTKGYTIKWKAVADAPMYKVYRKTFGGNWTVAGYTSKPYFIDSNADMSQPTAYTLRCVSKTKQKLSSFNLNEIYYRKGKLAEGRITVNGKKYPFAKGKLCQGFVKLNGKVYYYDANGNIVKDKVVGNKTVGFYYAEKNGVITFKFKGIAKNDKGYWYCKNSKVIFTYRNAVTYDDKDWIVINGKAKEVETEKDRTLFRAFKEVAKCTDNTMTKKQKLKAAFKYVQGAYTEKNPRIPHYHGKGWVEMYANDMFVNQTGNCCSYGAAFAYMAKAIGYDDVYACNSGGHGWAEINGKVYDPEWGRHKKDKSYFGLDYDTCKDPAYKAAIAPGYWWMHVKV